MYKTLYVVYCSKKLKKIYIVFKNFYKIGVLSFLVAGRSSNVNMDKTVKTPFAIGLCPLRQVTGIICTPFENLGVGSQRLLLNLGREGIL
jgi:hypothetical protein